MISSCAREVSPVEIEDVTVKVDSCLFEICFNVLNNISDSALLVKQLDIFIYDADGMQGLESWNSFDGLPDTVRVTGAKRAKTVVAVANSPRSFNRKAIERYDSIELLSYDFGEDSPENPIMGGICSLGHERPGTVTLEPLLTKVVLCEVSNLMKGYMRLEDPRIYLENINESAEVLRKSGFRASEGGINGKTYKLPYDIGVFPQNLNIELLCYPNDSAEATMGTPRTSLVLECEINGETCRFPVELPELGRNRRLKVDISVSGPNVFESKVY
ncbi:MAG: hypothetical protein IJU69_02245 [Bacteroidales bacterium]|nr:hypothetical protein [Bacteroidales bacterium]MBQ9475061.1 hypothetical protein [Bacteroidales bacterium]